MFVTGNLNNTVLPIFRFSTNDTTTGFPEFFDDYRTNDNIFEYLGLRLPNTFTSSKVVYTLQELVDRTCWYHNSNGSNRSRFCSVL